MTSIVGAVSIDAGTGGLLAVVVAVLGVGVKALSDAGDRSASRLEAEVERVRKDKDDQIDALRADNVELRKERDHWLDLYAECRTGTRIPPAPPPEGTTQ